MSQTPLPPGYPPPPPPPALPPGPPYYAPAPAPPANGFAIASLVLGILSFVCMNCLTAIPGIIFGHVAMAQTGRLGSRTGGRGMAIAGLILSYLALAICLALLAFYVIVVLVAVASGSGNVHMNVHHGLVS